VSDVERVLWIDAAAGASGDMILGALVDLGAPLREVRRAVASLPLEGVKLVERRVTRGAVAATKVDVVVRGERGPRHVHDHRHDDHHVHDHGRDWKSIRRVISGGKLPSPVRDRALVIFRRLFEAEAKAHGMSPERVHLHEAGAHDAIADIVGASAALHAVSPDRIVVSPVTTGSGTVQCAHGLYPVPGPATAILLEGVPLSGIGADGERLTPTGAAILTSIAHAWGGVPAMTLRKIGHGAGSRDFPERPNVVRVLLGDRPAAAAEPIESQSPEILVIEFTLDDATPQLVAYAVERLREAGALDAHIAPVQMKKGRAGHLVTILARPEAFDAITRAALTETTTLGLRYRREGRIELDRGVERVSTPYGAIRVKTGKLDGTELHAWPEYEDCAAAARKHEVGLLAVQQAALAARKPRRR